MKTLYYYIGLCFALLSGCANTADQGSTVVDTINAESNIVLVAGATGRTGRLIVQQLLDQGKTVRAFVRNPDKARGLFGDRVEIVRGDVKDRVSVVSAMHGIQWVISAIGSGGSKDPSNIPEFVDYGGTKNLVEAAVTEKVKQFIMVSSRSAGQKEHMLNKRFNNVLIWKLKGENALRNSDIPYTVVRPGGLRDTKGGEHRLVAFSPKHGSSKLRMISRADVAATCVAALNNPDAVNKTIALVSDPSAPMQSWSEVFQPIPVDQGQY